MISKSNFKSVPCDGVLKLSLFISKQYAIKQLLDSFFDIRNNQDLGKRYQPRPSARLRTLTTLTSASIHPDITKTSSNKNNLKFSGYITNVRMHGFFFQLEVRHENQSNRPHVRIELDIIHYFKNIISLTFKVLLVHSPLTTDRRLHQT